MFKKICRVLVWVNLAVGIICTLVFTALVFEKSWDVVFRILFEGLFITFLSTVPLGLITEIAYDLYACRTYLKEIRDNQYNNNKYNNIAQNSDKAWICPDCGTTNISYADICDKCGKHK